MKPSIPTVPCRRFGRTELQIPVLSLGGMRFQQSWSDLGWEQIPDDNQANVEALLRRTRHLGIHHIETARHYGSSERQLGRAFVVAPDPRRIVQTKVPPRQDAQQFEAELEESMALLGCGRIDLLSIHGINLPEHLEQTTRPGGCLQVVRRWQRQDRIGHVGFSTHGPTDVIVAAIETDAFDYVNLHWYYIRQDNHPAIAAARRHDMGVFIISPTDKGGHLHSPSVCLLELCAPLHPIVFNDLFCLAQPGVHTISVGAAHPGDLELHLQAVAQLEDAPLLLPPILHRLEGEKQKRLGVEWVRSWGQGLPHWKDTPGQINLAALLWLYNLWAGWDLDRYVQARYGLMSSDNHWFPGCNANALDDSVSPESLRYALRHSPWTERILTILRQLKAKFGQSKTQRLSSA